MDVLKGISGSRGYCFGNAVVKTSTLPLPIKGLVLDYADEIAKFRRAQNTYYARLEVLADMASRNLGREAADIFRAYQVIVKDEAFFKNVFSRIEKDSVSIEFAVGLECKKIVAMFDSMDDDYMRERAVDVENVCNELINIMMGVDSDFSHKMEGMSDIILVAGNLTPAETVKLDKSVLRGIVTELGGVTSHTVILAKALGIPAIVGAADATVIIRDGDLVMLDGFSGEIEINPSEESLEVFAAVKQMYDLKRKLHSLAERVPAVTSDGFGISVTVSAWDFDSLRAVDMNRCDGIGLFSTESIFLLSKAYPSEEAQLMLYSEAVRRAGDKPLTFCALDISCDNQARYMNLPADANPFIGFKGIRFLLKRREMFKEQLRAVLRASALGNAGIMFPMITTLEDFLEAKACLEEEKNNLGKAGISYRENIPAGIVIETPAAVLISDLLAYEADFLIVDSNDLVQHITAADRMNTELEELNDFCNISVLRAIHTVSQNAEKAGIKWGIIGEAASDEILVPLWIAMGVGSLTVPKRHVGATKRLIDSVSRADMQKELGAVLKMRKIEDVRKHMNKVFSHIDM